MLPHSFPKCWISCIFLAILSWANWYSPRKCLDTVQGQHRLSTEYTLAFPVCDEDEPAVPLRAMNASCTVPVIFTAREGDVASFNHRCSPSFIGRRKRCIREDALAGTDELSSSLLGSARAIAHVRAEDSVGVHCCWICSRKAVTAHSPALPLRRVIWLANSTFSFHNFKWLFFSSSFICLI